MTFDSPRQRFNILFTISLCIFAAIELYLSRHVFLDDTFIHLRIAHNLLKYGHYSFNGADTVFATSSPLYTVILAAVSTVIHADWMPKLVNIVIYATILFLILGKTMRSSKRPQTLLLLASALVAASPLAIRWMTDGMETGLVALCAILLGAAAHAANHDQRLGTPRAVAICLLSALAVLLRVEFAFILALAVAAISYRHIRNDSTTPWLAGLRVAVQKTWPFMLGGCVGVAAIVGAFGHLLPDTAVAKQTQITSINVIQTLKTIVTVHLSGLSFGVGMFMVWLISAVLAYRADRNNRGYIAVANAGMLIFVLLLIVSHQPLQGIRYFVFLEVFLIAVNILSLKNAGFEYQPRLPTYLLVGAVSLGLLFDVVIFSNFAAKASEDYKRFAETDYSYLADKTGVGYDIGMLGYFTRGHILDMAGLVNGREDAAKTRRQRLEQLTHVNVDFVFVNEEQLRAINRYLDTSGWKTVSVFDFPHIGGGSDRHFFLVRPRVLPDSVPAHNS